MYAKIVDGKIVGVLHSLPKVYQNVSGFDCLDLETVISYGFFPMEEVKPSLSFNSIDDGEKDENGNTIYRKVFTQAYGQPSDSVGNGRVIRTYPIIDLPVEEVRTETNRPILKSIALIEAKQARAVREAALGDTTHLVQINSQIESLRARLV